MDNSMDKFMEYMKLIAEYDWAVEGFPAPAGVKLARQDAIEIRNALVKLASEVASDEVR